MKILFITESLKPDAGWGRYSADLVTALENMHIEVVVCEIKNPLKFKKHFLLSWWRVLKLHAQYREHKFDAIHCAIEPYAFITAVFATLKRTPYFLTIHGTYGVLFLTHPIYKFFQKYAYANARSIVAVSNYSKRRVLEQMKLSNIVVIPNGIGFLPKSSKKKTKEQNVIISVGGIKGRKGYHLVIDALDQIKDSIEPFFYYIVGGKHDTLYVERLLRLIEKKGLRDNVVITGFVSQEEKDRLYQEADIFVLPSISEGKHFEGFGLVYLEAGALGIPVVGSLESGAEDAIKNGETGILVPQNDSKSLAEAMLKILKDDSLAEQMSISGVQWARAHHWNNIVPKYIEIYKQTK